MPDEIDYDKMGLKCGLEIHQQLDTKKLFCNCPSILRKDEPDFVVERQLHAVAGESGEVDVAAKYQAGLGKRFFYQGYDTTCLVELDESPPRMINGDALKIAMQVATLLNCKILSLTQIMRKTVVDGSNTSGFQRTVLIAVEGYVETKYGRVGIESVCLEEDSARIIGKNEKGIVYRLDRLGIPLIEIATKPEIKNPEQAKEVALHLGNVLRSCKVKRGIGTIRQDVNVSIKKGARVEIKGVQEPNLIEKSVEKEAERQFELISKKTEVKSEVRKVLLNGETEFLRPMPGAARMYPETDLPLLKISRELINEIKKNLPKLKAEVEEELKGKGLEEEMIKLLFKRKKIEEFKEFLNLLNNPKLIAKMLLVFPNEIASKEKISIDEVEKILSDDTLVAILKFVKDGKIQDNQVRHVMERIVQGESLDNAVEFDKREIHDVEEKVHKIIKEKPGLSENAYMGLVMKEFKGKINGSEAMEIIKKYVR
ncbi:MAG: Glu-tRNA(Gln) amidotransferase subunit GatE [Nanoarchaeota archaeon]